MDVNKILMEYDGMFGSYSLDDIEKFLVDSIYEAREQEDKSSEFTLLNEIIGFCRDTTQNDKGIMYCKELLALMKDMGIEDTLEYATALLNIGNAYRGFGRSDESMECYKKTLEIYSANLDDNDFGYANLYNNWALLYQELGDFESARECLYKALKVVDSYGEAEIQQAITRTNLGSTLVAIGTKEACDEAEKVLLNALSVFERDGGKDFHYNGALVGMGDLMCRKKCYMEAVDFYEKGLAELEKHVGRNDNYNRVKEKFDYAIKKYEDRETETMLKEDILEEKQEYQEPSDDVTIREDNNVWKNNIARSREFYEKYGRKMLHNRFPEYESKIAVGIVGMGSDCYGFDDEISTDHDYDIGFCMWLTPDVYDEIGAQLIAEYKNLLREAGVDENAYGRLVERRGVFEIKDFYQEFLGDSYNLGNASARYEDYQLAAVTNGTIFRDDLGEFTSVRNKLLEYYDDRAWRMKLVKAVHNFSQYGQSNYARMMARQDYVTANMCISMAVESAMDLTYLLARTYAPYYKWKFKGLEKLINERKWINIDKLFELRGLLEELSELGSQANAWENVVYDAAVVNYRDKKLVIIDKIAEALLSELKSKDLATGDDVFLQNHEPYITKKLRRTNRVNQIVEIEWEMFDKVKNEGGRADCEDDWNTFSIMRKSQYMAWSKELQESYLTDLEIASSKGWNMIMEKYARMMKNTCPEKYEGLKKDLPKLTDDRIAIQESIIAIQVEWMEDFAAQYPKMAGNSRSIRTETDNEYNTSYETYLRGEISTYSERTFVLYGKFVAELHRQGKNLAYKIMNNTARLYGYASVEDAESRL